MNDIEGERVATIILAYNHDQRGIKDVLSDIQHKFLVNIRSTVHVHLQNGNCMKVIILHGEGKKVKEIFENLVKNKGLKYVKLNTIIPEEI
jgi:CopG family nickel-responsive transcriptional regulator